MIRGRRVSGSEGLTLIELLVAVVMISVVMLMGARFIVQQVQQVGVSEAQAQSYEYAMEELERTKLLPFDSIQAKSPAPVPEAPRYTRWTDVEDVGGGATDLYHYRVVTVTVEPPSDAVPPVEVTTAVAR